LGKEQRLPDDLFSTLNDGILGYFLNIFLNLVFSFFSRPNFFNF